MNKSIHDPDNVLTTAEYAVLTAEGGSNSAAGAARAALRRDLYAREIGWCPNCARAGQPAAHPQDAMRAVNKRVGYSCDCSACSRARGAEIARRHTASRSKVSAAEIYAALEGRLFACCDCGEVLPATGFNINRMQTHGIRSMCRACSRARALAHQKARPDLNRAKGARRRALKRTCESTSSATERDAIATLYADAALAAAFMGHEFHVDHREPLAKGGSNTIDNLQILPASMNCSKGDLAHEEALERVEGYREWVEGPPTFNSVTVVPPERCRECLLAVGVRSV